MIIPEILSANYFKTVLTNLNNCHTFELDMTAGYPNTTQIEEWTPFQSQNIIGLQGLAFGVRCFNGGTYIEPDMAKLRLFVLEPVPGRPIQVPAPPTPDWDDRHPTGSQNTIVVMNANDPPFTFSPIPIQTWGFGIDHLVSVAHNSLRFYIALYYV